MLRFGVQKLDNNNNNKLKKTSKDHAQATRKSVYIIKHIRIDSEPICVARFNFYVPKENSLECSVDRLHI